jgi:hypothetical protein
MCSPSHSNAARLATTCVFLLAILFCTSATAGAIARETIRGTTPNPPNGGPGLTILPVDQNPQPPARSGYSEQAARERFREFIRSKDGSRTWDEIGGDDIHVYSQEHARAESIDIDSNGNIFIAVALTLGEESEIRIFRSTDHGSTFQMWGRLWDAAYVEEYVEPCLRVVEGTVEACYVAYSVMQTGVPNQIRMVSSPLDGDLATWSSPVTVLADASIDFAYARFTTDVTSYSGFYIYLVAEGDDFNGTDIWFTRSTNQGASWESPYMLATLNVSDRMYCRPDIAYGFGGHLHVTWYFRDAALTFDPSIRYRHGANWASNGLADWDYWQTMTSTSNGSSDTDPRIEAAKYGPEVVLIFSRYADEGYDNDPGLFVSMDNGTTFGSEIHLTDAFYLMGDIEEDPATDTWYIGGGDFNEPVIQRAHVSDLTSWSAMEHFSDHYYEMDFYNVMGLALNPAMDNRPAMTWWNGFIEADNSVYFDGEWRGDPGYPNYEEDFPIDLAATPISPPAVADIDGDGDLEIVFSDADGNIQVFSHNGTPLPGWPVDVDTPLSDGPVAIGDLDGDGELDLVVGTADGEVYAYDRTGQLMTGWPSQITGTGQSVYVSLGALGGPYPLTVVACSDHNILFRNNRGISPLGTHGWNLNPDYDFHYPAACGDIDNDGITEVVAGFGPFVVGVELYSLDMQFQEYIGNLVSDAVTLADIDGEGDVEIFAPTETGVLYGFDGDGSYLPGFPFDTGSGYELTSAAIAQMLGTWEPELAFASKNQEVHLIYSTGSEYPGYPNYTTVGWWIYGAPIVGRVDGTSSDVIIGDRGNRCWAWSNLGALVPGFPKEVANQINLSPAMGDLDLDGSVELVALTNGQLLVMDLNQTETDASRTWPMYGHDPQRTGCSDCPQDVTTAVQSPVGTTRVSFAAPSPNPIIGSTTFSYSIPVEAVVALDIFDVRGRRVYTVSRTEQTPGPHVVIWHGKNNRGQSLPSGQYLARLTVDGPGISDRQVRKITILR